MNKVNDIFADLGMFLLVAFLALYTSGCGIVGSSAGGKFYCGYEEVNEVKNTQGYTVKK